MTSSIARLTDWAVNRVGATDQHRLYLRCRNEVAGQIERRLGTALRPRLTLNPDDWGEWTHRYPLTRRLDDDEFAFLDAMKRVLTLRIGPPVKVAIALDHYQDPSSHEDPMQWRKTAIGNLVQKGKYADSDASLAQLATELSTFMDSHPDLRTPDVIIGVPSHSPRRFSERLAGAVGQLRGIPVAEVADDIPGPIKDTDPSTRRAPRFQMDPTQVAGKAVLIIDDLVRSAESLRFLARHLDSEGADSICVLAAVRTMRN